MNAIIKYLNLFKLINLKFVFSCLWKNAFSLPYFLLVILFGFHLNFCFLYKLNYDFSTFSNTIQFSIFKSFQSNKTITYYFYLFCGFNQGIAIKDTSTESESVSIKPISSWKIFLGILCIKPLPQRDGWLKSFGRNLFFCLLRSC